MTRHLHAVPDVPEQRTEVLVRQCLERRGQLRRQLAAEETELTELRHSLARQRGVAFLRVEALEQEFGR